MSDERKVGERWITTHEAGYVVWEWRDGHRCEVAEVLSSRADAALLAHADDYRAAVKMLELMRDLARQMPKARLGDINWSGGGASDQLSVADQADAVLARLRTT